MAVPVIVAVARKRSTFDEVPFVSLPVARQATLCERQPPAGGSHPPSHSVRGCT